MFWCRVMQQSNMLQHIVFMLVLALPVPASSMMQSLAVNGDDDNQLLSSFIIINELGQKLPNKPPVIADLQKLCKAASQCTRNIHHQLVPLFIACKLPLFSSQAPPDFVVLFESSPVDTFLKALRLLDPNQNGFGIPLIDDYVASTCTHKDVQETVQRTESAPLLDEGSPESPRAPLSTSAPAIKGDRTSFRELLSTAASYPLAPFISVIAYMRNPAQEAAYQAKEEQRAKLCIVREVEIEEKNQIKYGKVLKHGKQLLTAIAKPNEEAQVLLEKAKAQLIALQKGILSNIESVELDRASFAILEQCILRDDLTLSDMFLLQYSKMLAYNAPIDLACPLFFGDAVKTLTQVTQQQFYERWNHIQQQYREDKITREQFDQLRQYSYILQNPSSRYLAQAFIDKTISKHGITPQEAQRNGLTEEHRKELNAELINCKDFLQQLNRAFNDSIKNIDAALKK